MNFLAFMLLLVTSHATVPPNTSANSAESTARVMELSMGL